MITYVKRNSKIGVRGTALRDPIAPRSIIA